MKPLRPLVLCTLLLAAAPVFAQRGCFHSPEAPTDVLLLVGSVGMTLGSAAVRRFLRRRAMRSFRRPGVTGTR